MKSDMREYIKNYYAYWLGLNNVYEEWAKSYGLSSFALYTLYAIWEAEEPISQKKICAEWLMPKQTVNTIIKKFETEGYITFTVIAEDKRNKAVTLTPKGRTYANHILSKLYKLEGAVMAELGEENRTVMMKTNHLFLTIFKDAIRRENQNDSKTIL